MNPNQAAILYLVTEVKNIAEEKAEEKADNKRCDLQGKRDVSPISYLYIKLFMIP